MPDKMARYVISITLEIFEISLIFHYIPNLLYSFPFRVLPSFACKVINVNCNRFIHEIVEVSLIFKFHYFLNFNLVFTSFFLSTARIDQSRKSSVAIFEI